MKSMAMMAAVLMVVAGCATTEPVQSAAAAPVSTAPTAAANAPVVASAGDGTAAAVPGKLRCKHMPILGSRVGKKVCRTEEEWAALEKQAKEIMQDLEAKPLGRQEGD